MEPYFENEWGKLYHGDCLEIMQSLEAGCAGAIVTDPPYGLAFMGKKWDYDVPSVEIWKAALNLLPHGGHLLSFAGTRTQHRMCCNIEDAGFEIRDMIAWVYGSGFPKSMDVSKAIDKAAGVEREVIGSKGLHRFNTTRADKNKGRYGKDHRTFEQADALTAPTTEAAKQWDGWGTALKPALEPVTLARKPLDGTVARNVLKHGVGGLNIDGCRASWPNGEVPEIGTSGWGGPSKKLTAVTGQEGKTIERSGPNIAGRWPANLIHDGSEESVCALGSASRFFYCAKASRSERGKDNNHPTVKPLALMSHLITLICPMGVTVLDPFGGSGTTALAAQTIGRKWILIEREEEYCEIIAKRVQSYDASEQEVIKMQEAA